VNDVQRFSEIKILVVVASSICIKNVQCTRIFGARLQPTQKVLSSFLMQQNYLAAAQGRALRTRGDLRCRGASSQACNIDTPLLTNAAIKSASNMVC